ncbi:hypothetical protein BKA70DRAFT_1570710 [Coprinopsis sp. MPI-PUGE-AT-0042]|nr:hypothetical protein BKA70DRAFT_1570710 [Coprinopsis sp. MPI-PUGE-AT-0042]
MSCCDLISSSHRSLISGQSGRPTTSKSHVDVEEKENVLVELETIGSAVICVRNRAFCLLPAAVHKAVGIIPSQHGWDRRGSAPLGFGSTPNANEAPSIQIKSGERCTGALRPRHPAITPPTIPWNEDVPIQSQDQTSDINRGVANASDNSLVDWETGRNEGGHDSVP